MRCTGHKGFSGLNTQFCCELISISSYAPKFGMATLWPRTAPKTRNNDLNIHRNRVVRRKVGSKYIFDIISLVPMQHDLLVIVYFASSLIMIYIVIVIRVAEVVRGHGGPPPKSLDSDENFKPEHSLVCRKLRFVAIYAFFGDLWAKKVPFWVKNSVSWARSALLHGIYCICH